MTHVRLWSVQAELVWRQLLTKGTLRADGRRVQSASFRLAYRWLMAQMATRLPQYGGGWPFWGWYQPRPDLRTLGHLAPGDRGVLIELSMSRDRVLLSDFDTWHAVLAGRYLSVNKRDDDAWDRAPRGETAKRASWQRIFDLRRRPSRWLGRVSHVQGTFEELRLADVLSARPFIAR